MSAAIDHTIVPSRNTAESAEFYSRILGFEDLGEVPPRNVLHSVRVNESTVLFFESSSEGSPWAEGIHHIAIYMDERRFDEAFTRIKSAGIPFGDNYANRSNMKGPGVAPGAKGTGRSVYFDDPSGNLLQIISY